MLLSESLFYADQQYFNSSRNPSKVVMPFTDKIYTFLLKLQAYVERHCLCKGVNALRSEPVSTVQH